MSVIRVTILICGLLLCGSGLRATHNRAGEITYRHLGAYQYEVTITTYTKSDSPADRPALGINWGDNTGDTLPRVNGNGQGELVAGDIKRNIYIGIHTYPGPAVYELFFEDPNRNGGVVNIPNSINIPFYVSSRLVIHPFLGVNNSVRLLNPPIDRACPGQLFIHNPGAWDPDGDSISYRLVQCRGENGMPIPGFSQPAATSLFSLNSLTGDLVWDTPLLNGIGEYNVAFVIEEWRYGVLIGSVTRDMQIEVVPCSNQPPQIEPLPDLCVDAGALVQFTVKANDPDSPLNLVTLTATGGPFLFDPPFMASFPGATAMGSVSQLFVWQTDCRHVRKQPYQVSFKAIDNGNPNLADFGSVSIRVVAPAPPNLQAEATGTTIRLAWEQSPCRQATGYRVYRRSDFYGFEPDTCETGVPAYTGYSLIATVNGVADTMYTDSAGLVAGINYCYLVIAVFADGAESYASNEACTTLKKELPVLTHVSIRHTATANGSVWVQWSKPTELDTVQWPGPYLYIVERTYNSNVTGFVPVDTLYSLNDTTFTDSSAVLNTQERTVYYRITLEQAGSARIGHATPAGSVFIIATGEDKAVRLSWAEQVPWQNTAYVVFRKDPGSEQFDSIGTTQAQTYRDEGLVNGSSYCYRLKSVGSYSAGGFADPLENFSQETCVVPIDLVAPCPPVVLVDRSCDSLQNNIRWGFDNPECSPDVLSTRLYYAPFLNDSLRLIAEYPGKQVNQFVHLPGPSVAGCYAVTAVDSAQNESVPRRVCVDNCPVYELPNTFSPNGDGVNDAFHPFPYAFIESVEIRIFNRWGKEVFVSQDPDILWDGREQQNNKLLPDGVYFYVCTVNEIRLQGIVSRTLKGTIQLIGSVDAESN